MVEGVIFIGLVVRSSGGCGAVDWLRNWRNHMAAARSSAATTAMARFVARDARRIGAGVLRLRRTSMRG
jgi:hypothetical protein